MSIFIARYKKNTFCLNWQKDGLLFKKNLPFTPSKISTYNFTNTELIIYSFNIALERKPYITDDRVTIIQGYGLDDLEIKFEQNIAKNSSLDHITFHETFCTVSISDNVLNFATSSAGVDSLFYLETKNEFIVTNRHNLLQTYIEKEKLPFRKSAFAWIVGRGHLSDFGTYWEGIEKSLPTVLYTYKNKLTSSFVPFYKNKTITNTEINSTIKDVTNYFDELVDSIETKKRIWLSGGKDSRAITGILANSTSFDKFDFVTHGDAFSPDVMAAKDITQKLSATDRHSVNAPSLSQGNINIFSRIAEDLSWCNSGNSLADLKSFKENELLVIGGHENGFKTNINTLELDDYVASRKYWIDNKSILSSSMFEAQFSNYTKLLKSILKDVPVSKYAKMESLYFRNGTFIASAFSASHAGTSEVHPLLDGKMLDLWLHASDEALKSQLIHYLMTKEAGKNLESLPFAGDSWPDSLNDILNKMHLEFEKTPQAPYEFKKYYPSERAFGVYKWRVELVRISTPFLLKYLKNHSFFDFINYEKLESLASKDLATLTLGDIYFWLGILKACMVYEFGLDALDFTKKEETAKKIEELFKKYTSKEFIAKSDFSGTTKEEEIESLKNKLADYEKCIVEMIQLSKNKVSHSPEQKPTDNTKKYLYECQNSASFKLGHLLIHETKSLSDIVNLPKKILKIKKES